MPSKKIIPAKLEISPEKHAKMVAGGMERLMERKRKSSPHFYTEEFNAQLGKLVREINAQKKKARKK